MARAESSCMSHGDYQSIDLLLHRGHGHAQKLSDGCECKRPERRPIGHTRRVLYPVDQPGPGQPPGSPREGVKVEFGVKSTMCRHPGVQRATHSRKPAPANRKKWGLQNPDWISSWQYGMVVPRHGSKASVEIVQSVRAHWRPHSSPFKRLLLASPRAQERVGVPP